MKVAEVIAAWEALAHRARHALHAMGRNYPGDEALSMKIDGDRVTVEWEELEYGEPREMETQSETLPLAVLEMEDGVFQEWAQSVIAQRHKEREAQRRAQAERDAASAALRERQEYERLKAKFEGGGR